MKHLKISAFIYFLLASAIFVSCGGDDTVDISGNIYSLSDLPVRRATITLSDSVTGKVFTTTLSDTNGKFIFYNLDKRQALLTFKRTGFSDTSYIIHTGRFVQKIFHIRGGSSLTGNVIDGNTGQGMPDAKLLFYNLAKLNAATPDTMTEYVIIPDASGYFSHADVPTGIFNCKVISKGYVTKRINYIDFQTNNTINLGYIVLTEYTGSNKIKLILSWTTDVNLDAHLTGPVSGSEQLFHCWQGNAQPVGSCARMAISDDNKPGPEIIEITDMVNGIYKMWVSNMTDTSPSGSEAMKAQAKVEIYNFEGLVQTITAPADGSGNSWEVLKIDSFGGNYTITAKNRYFQYYP